MSGPSLSIPAPNLIVVVLDCVRAKSVGGVGPARKARTPHLDRIAEEGASFSHAVAPGNWTIPSHMSMLTGTYPWVHGLRSFQREGRQLPKIATWLRARGYETGLFTEEVHLVAGYGLEEGFEHRWARRFGTSDDDRTATNRIFGHSSWVYSRSVRRVIESVPRLAIPLSALNFQQEASFKREVCGEYLNQAFERWLASRITSRPFFALFNFVDAHEPYVDLVPRPFLGGSRKGFAQVPRYYMLAVPALREQVDWSYIESGYLSGIERADAKVGRLRESLERAGVAENTMLVITSDHGQSFGESGNVYHGCGATDSVLRVPLYAWGHGVAPGAIDAWTSLCEIPSWLKSSALGLEPFDALGSAPVPFPSSSTSGRTVLAEGGPASDPNRSLLGIRPEERWNHRLIAAYQDQVKVVWDTHTNEMWTWSTAGDPDAQAAVPLSPEQREAALRSTFRIAQPEDAQRFRPREGAPPRRPLDDSRLRSWGYD